MTCLEFNRTLERPDIELIATPSLMMALLRHVKECHACAEACDETTQSLSRDDLAIAKGMAMDIGERIMSRLGDPEIHG